MGSQTGEDPPESPKEETKIEIPEGEGDGKEEGSGTPKAAEEGGNEAEKQAYYEKQLEQLAADEAESDDEFVPLYLKKLVADFHAENPNEKKIPSELMSEAFRWRLSQNDC